MEFVPHPLKLVEEVTPVMVEDPNSPHDQFSRRIIEDVLGGLEPKRSELMMFPLEVSEESKTSVGVAHEFP